MAMICGAMRWTDGGRGNREEGEKDEGAVENGFDSIDFSFVFFFVVYDRLGVCSSIYC